MIQNIFGIEKKAVCQLIGCSDISLAQVAKLDMSRLNETITRLQ